MRKHEPLEEFLKDVDSRQRNIVFPDTTRNEARFWKNIGNPAFNTPAKIGLAVIGISVFGTVAFVLRDLTRENDGVEQLAIFALKYVLFFGPIFAAIAWATHRTLRKAARTRTGARPVHDPDTGACGGKRAGSPAEPFVTPRALATALATHPPHRYPAVHTTPASVGSRPSGDQSSD